MTTTTTQTPTVTTFQGLTVVTGKGVTPANKLAQHINNGAHVGALLFAGVNRKTITDSLGLEGMQTTIKALAGGDIRPAAALIVAKSGKAVSIMEVDGRAPYAEFLRLGATLRTMPQLTKAGKPTNAAKALALFDQLASGSQALRLERQALQALKISEA